MATRFSLATGAEAKSKKHTAKENKKESKKRRPRPERKAAGSLQADGKRKKKRGKKPNNPRPPVCDGGKPRCSDGSCVPVGNCCPGSRRCDYDGFCRKEDECCPDQKRCPDESCVSVYECCPGETRCDDGSCAAADACCPDQGKCPDGSCVDHDACCPGEKQCVGGGHCYPADYCCPEERECPDGSCAPAGACCPGEKQCFPGAPCVSASYCCYSEQPECGFCKRLACENGSWVCQELREECPGGEWDPARCRCKYCEETCDPVTHLCTSNCPDGHQCVEGQCQRVCTEPSKPQICCIEQPWYEGRVVCYCAAATDMCFPCRGNLCICTPGGDPQRCCDPDFHGPFCPEACHCPCRPEAPKYCS